MNAPGHPLSAAAASVALLDRVALEQRLAAFHHAALDAAWARQCLLFRHPHHAELVTATPAGEALIAWADGVAGVPVVAHLAAADDIRDLLLALRRGPVAPAAPESGMGAAAGRVLDIDHTASDAGEAAARLDEVLLEALRAGASDVHFEALPAGLRLRLRIDGVLETAGLVEGQDLARRLVSRIKVLADLDIAEQRVPQDGRLAIASGGRRIDLRVSVMPSIHGEDVVLRILDKQRLAGGSTLRLDALGFDNAAVDFIRSMSRRPHGMLLVTGPTGSGKTTTLYAALGEVNGGLDKIVTIEDPVEYQLAGVLQIPVNEAKGLTFARGLRSILRHDPDRIMVGEIRDEETAQIAVQAALTGHSVFSSVHANDVFAVLGRFLQLGADAHNFVSALNGIVAQRLLRGVCPHCAAPAGDGTMAGRGCGHCRGTGHAGRHAVAQTLAVDDAMREAIASRQPLPTLKAMAAERGTRSLRNAAMALARQGRTSLAEVERVTDG